MNIEGSDDEVAEVIREEEAAVNIKGSVDELAGGTREEAKAVNMEGSVDEVAEGTREEAVAVNMEGSVDEIAEGTREEEDLDPYWVISFKQKHPPQPRRLKASSNKESCSIHRVPHSLRQHDEKAYVPRIISIGPFHYDRRKDHLQAMEEHKGRYLHDILTRNGENRLQKCLKAVKKLEEKARACYSEEFELDSNSFVEMMVLDGCFLVELFYRKWSNESRLKDDPLLRLDWLKDSLLRDLFTLENQIPFFVLETIFDLMNISGDSLANMVLYYFDCLDRQYKTPVQHLLHLLHSLDPLPEVKSQGMDNIKMIPCASNLQEAGVKFKKANPCKSFWNIKFQNGVLEIPTWEMYDNDNIYIMNFIAFEQCYRFCDSYYTTYSTFMDCLINSSEDVRILSDNGIIQSWGNNEGVVTLFNKVGRDVIIPPDDFYLREVFDGINRHCEAVCPRLRATLMRDYFKNPWAIISFLAGVLLLLLTFSQSFFSAFPKFAYQGK